MKERQFVPAIRKRGPSPYQNVEKAQDGDYDITSREYGYRLHLNCSCVPSLAKLWRKYPICEVSLGGALGWEEPDVSFLLDLPKFKRLTLNPAGPLKWQVIEQLGELEELRIINAARRPAHEIKLSALPRLQRVELPWWPEWSSILFNENVRSLQITDAKRLPQVDCSRMRSLLELQLIRCSDCKLARLGNQKLVALELSVCPRFAKIEADTDLDSIEYLLLHGPISWDYRHVRRFYTLKQLTLANMGRLASLNFLRELKSLEYVDFGAPTIVEDGDLHFLDDLPELKAVAYDKSQKHYFPKRGKDWQDMLMRRRYAAGWNF